LPFNLESATGVDIRETTNLPFICFDMSIAADSRQTASSNQRDTHSKQNDRDLLHVTDFSNTMSRYAVLDSRKIQEEAQSQNPRR